jgi:hypothetical protein
LKSFFKKAESMEMRSYPFQFSHHISLLHDVPVLLFKAAYKELKKTYYITGTGRMIVREFYAAQRKLLSAS